MDHIFADFADSGTSGRGELACQRGFIGLGNGVDGPHVVTEYSERGAAYQSSAIFLGDHRPQGSNGFSFCVIVSNNLRYSPRSSCMHGLFVMVAVKCCMRASSSVLPCTALPDICVVRRMVSRSLYV